MKLSFLWHAVLILNGLGYGAVVGKLVYATCDQYGTIMLALTLLTALMVVYVYMYLSFFLPMHRKVI